MQLQEQLDAAAQVRRLLALAGVKRTQFMHSGPCATVLVPADDIHVQGGNHYPIYTLDYAKDAMLTACMQGPLPQDLLEAIDKVHERWPSPTP